MKVLRIILQFVILIAGGISLAALISQPGSDITPTIVFLGFLAFLLALTLLLKEHTDERLVPGHKLSLKPLSIVLLVSGAFGIFHGISLFTSSQPLQNGNDTCRALCGLILLASQLFGETVARFFAFGLWSGIGLFLCSIGYKAWRMR